MSHRSTMDGLAANSRARFHIPGAGSYHRLRKWPETESAMATGQFNVTNDKITASLLLHLEVNDSGEKAMMK